MAQNEIDGNLLLQYENAKNVLMTSRNAFRETKSKMVDRMDEVDFGYFQLLAILMLAFTVLFYKMTPVESTTSFLIAMITSVMIIGVTLFLWRLQVKSIKEKVGTLDERYAELKAKFTALSKTRIERDEDLQMLVTSGTEYRQLQEIHNWAEQYDGLTVDQRVSKIEAFVF